MKTVPRSFELDEEDIKKAIAYYLHLAFDAKDISHEDIQFKVTRKQEPPKSGPMGGMADWIETEVITATAKCGGKPTA